MKFPIDGRTGERDGDRYQHTEGIKLSGRRLPADIPKSKLVEFESVTKLDPKKQLREAGYPFDHIGSELIRMRTASSKWFRGT